MTQNPPPDRRTTRKKPPKKAGGGGAEHTKALAEARTATQARRSVARLEVEPVEVIQEVLDGVTADLRFTQRKVDGLKPEEFWRDTMLAGKIPNEWIRLRDEYRTNVATLAGRMVERGIAEKAVNVSAARAALMATMVQEALRRAGADATLVARAGEELRQIAAESQEPR